MKKIIPFKKDIIFKTNLAEITSISLEHTLDVGTNNEITGNFIVSGDYKIADNSTNVEPFSYELPFHINMDEKYILDSVKVDIDDFYYEIINDNVLSVNIEVLIDKLEEKQIVEKLNELEGKNDNLLKKDIEENRVIDESNNLENNTIDDNKELNVNIINEPNIDINEINISKTNPVEKQEVVEARCVEPEDNVEQISSLFENFSNTTETYKSYKVYIVREGDNLESIMEKYNSTKEILEEYNDLKEIKIGDKIIIPT